MRKHYFKIGQVLARVNVLLLLSGALLGCALQPVAPDPFEVFPQKFREEAFNYEKAGLYPEALLRWKVVTELCPEDTEAKKHRFQLQALLQREAESSFQRGVEFYRQNRREEARDAFLRTLYLDNSHHEALDYLKNRMSPAAYTVHVAKPGETLRAIAAESYRDAEKVFLLVEINPFDPNALLVPGTEIKLPLLDTLGTVYKTSRFKMPLVYAKEKILAQKPQINGKFSKDTAEKSTPAVAELPGKPESPAHIKAKGAIDDLIYQKGKKLLRDKKYQQAFAVFAMLEEGYKDVGQIKTFLQLYLNREAEKHYNRGLEYFNAKEFQLAMNEWQQTLSLNPDHQKALDDLARAKKLQEQLNESE